METERELGVYRSVSMRVTFLFMGKAIEWKLGYFRLIREYLITILPLHGEGDRMETRMEVKMLGRILSPSCRGRADRTT